MTVDDESAEAKAREILKKYTFTGGIARLSKLAPLGNIFLQPAFQFAVETAMRQHEMLTLSWGAIDRERNLAMLLDPNKIKTGKPRAVPLSYAALAAIDSLPKVKEYEKNDLIFPVERLTLYHAFKGACKRAKISDFTWHDLRHEAVSRLAEDGDFSEGELKIASGHQTTRMLMRYTHLNAEKLAQKINSKLPKRNDKSGLCPSPECTTVLVPGALFCHKCGQKL